MGEKPGKGGEMSDRERIFEAIRTAVAKTENPAPLPEYSMDSTVSISRLGAGGWSGFQKNFEAVNGDFLETGEDLKALLTKEKAKVGYCPENLQDLVRPHLPEGIELRSNFDRSKINEYDFGITKATSAIAETGTLILEDSKTPDRLGALAPWIHIALVDKSSLLDTVATAIKSLPKDPNVIWVTGPSKTADVEGILIEGVHGPGIQACLLV